MHTSAFAQRFAAFKFVYLIASGSPLLGQLCSSQFKRSVVLDPLGQMAQWNTAAKAQWIYDELDKLFGEGAHDDKGAHDELKPKAKTIDDELDELFGEGAHDELKPKAKLSDDELDELFDCAFGKPPVQQVGAEAEAAAEAAARKRTIDAIMASKTFDEICLNIASGPPPKRRQAAWMAACDH